MNSINVYVKDDEKYLEYVSDILRNKDFLKLANYTHHNSDRFQHSLNVSYYSYLISKKFNLDSKKIARAALLHDFFFVDNLSIGKFSRIKTLFLHPKLALDNSLKYYYLSDMERNIITSHMFPLGWSFPRYKESVLVDLVDNYISIHEALYAKKNELSAAYSFMFLFIFGILFRWK